LQHSKQVSSIKKTRTGRKVCFLSVHGTPLSNPPQERPLTFCFVVELVLGQLQVLGRVRGMTTLLPQTNMTVKNSSGFYFEYQFKKSHSDSYIELILTLYTSTLQPEQ